MNESITFAGVLIIARELASDEHKAGREMMPALKFAHQIMLRIIMRDPENGTPDAWSRNILTLAAFRAMLRTLPIWTDEIASLDMTLANSIQRHERQITKSQIAKPTEPEQFDLF